MTSRGHFTYGREGLSSMLNVVGAVELVQKLRKGSQVVIILYNGPVLGNYMGRPWGMSCDICTHTPGNTHIHQAGVGEAFQGLMRP
ncbi:hypothetical protein C8R48DRAFT_6079 [Suillus tomentosus]|nr:hypothetical protein C8R48DRAFT_6079 [Suillus tomentosus]